MGALKNCSVSGLQVQVFLVKFVGCEEFREQDFGGLTKGHFYK